MTVHPFPENPSLSDASLSGHIWIQELVTGNRLRFQVAESGLITFGAETERFDTREDTPLPYRRATAFVRDEIDIGALRSALDDTGSVTFLGIATLYEGIDYDWSELPPFLGVDIWSDDHDNYFAPDRTVRIYDALGLPTPPAVEKEAQAKYTDPGKYTSGDPSEAPDSAYCDGTVAGVIARDKSGGRGVAWWDEVSSEPESPHLDEPPSAEELAETYVPEERIESTVNLLSDTEGGATVERVLEHLIADTVRENYAHLYEGSKPVVPEDEFRSAVGERVQRHLS